jgi:uncharacterized protein
MSYPELIEAVKEGDYELAMRLIKNGSEINQEDQQGWTPLNFAAGKGDLSLVKLLVDNGADVFKVGRDQRTPYMIALAAGRVETAKYLRAMEEMSPTKKTEKSQLKYCKAYQLGSLRKYSGWDESRIACKNDNQEAVATGRLNAGNNETIDGDLTDDKIVFIHQDYSVTESIWRNENIIFDGADASWREYCTELLKFKIPDDLDLIVPSQSSG